MDQIERSTENLETASRALTAASRTRGWMTVRAIRTIATLTLGIVLPAYLLLSAHRAVVGLDNSVVLASELSHVAASLPEPIKQFKSGNDYSLLFATYVEQGIQRTLLNRLRMKAAIMQLGLAISCIGMLFIVFGIDGGGIEAGAAVAEKLGINVKVATSGAMVFVLGALLSAGGALMPSTHTGGTAQFWLGPNQAASSTTMPSSGAKPMEKLLQYLASCDQIKSTEESKHCRTAALESAGVEK